MGAVIALARAALKRRLRPLALMGITAALASLLGSLALLLFTGNAGAAEAMMARAAAPDMLIMGEEGLIPVADAATWWRARKGVKEVASYPILADFESNPRHGGKPMANMNFYLFESVGADRGVDRLLAVPGEAAPGGDPADGSFTASPCEGEIWITSAVARAFGVAKGDGIGVMTSRGEIPLKVSAIVIDPLFNPGMMNPRRAWVAPGFLAENMAASKLGSYALAVAYAPGSPAGAAEEAWNDFAEAFGFSGSRITKPQIIGAYGFLSSILAAVMSFLAGIALVGTIAILQATVSGAVRSDYRIIGMYQTMGLGPGAIAGVFLLQFIPVLLLFAGLGSSLAPLGFSLAAKASLEATGTSAPSIDARPLIAISTAISLVCCAAAAIIASLKSASVRTAEAIRLGEALPKTLSKADAKPLGSLFPLWASLGFRQARLGARRSVATAIAVFFTAFAAYAAIACLGAMADLSGKPDFFGNTESQVILKRDGKRFAVESDRLTAELGADASVRSVLAQGFFETTFPGLAGGAPRTIYGQAYDGDMDAAGLKPIEGRNPRAPLEAAIAVNTARDYGLRPGSSLRIRVQGQPIDLRVVGIFQSMNNMGQGLRFSGDTPRALFPDYQPIVFDVFLAGTESPEAFARRTEARYGEAVDAQITADVMGAFVDSLLSGMSGAVAAAAAIFLAITAAAMAGATSQETREQERSFAALFLIGMEARDLRRAMAAKAFLVSAIAAFAGAASGAAVSPLILLSIIRGMGLVKMPFFIDVPAALLVAAAVAAWSTFIAWLTARASLRADARSLVTE
jgi:putative ABC transport system permease protein